MSARATRRTVLAAETESGVFPPLDPKRAVRALRRADPKLARLIALAGPCRLSPTHYPPFRALFRSIVYQQLSGKAAATILGRVLALFAPKEFPDPEDVLRLDDAALRAAGLSRNKLLAVRDLAQKTLDGVVPDLQALARMDDQEIIDRCDAVRGVGRWTVEMMLIFNLGRPDVLPVDDLGVRKGAQRVYGLRKLPDAKKLEKLAEPWRPWRSVGSWYMWRAAELPRGTL
ncbi:MAG: DNA-3-methyladenine glycosylase 2 family protein [Myxococcaceae bacterium]|nr:DNA-3-methyladenine glycosylase 2 family protein [Myxococcaceae bacterium]